MRHQILILGLFLLTLNIKAQEVITEITPNPFDTRVITTGVPFLLIAADARAGSLGDMGVATSVDAFSQQWNASKYAFSETKQGVGVSYTPYLTKLVKDIFLGSITYFNRIDEKSAFAASFRYFSLGDIEFVQDEFSIPLVQRPNEFTVDVSYALKLSQQFSMAVTMRYLNSDLRIPSEFTDTKAAGTFGVDISGYYQSEEEAFNSFNGRTRLGFAIQNVGPKFKYDEQGRENFQPTTLRLGGGFDFIFDNYNKLGVTAEVTKLLVPTPPIRGTYRQYEDINGNGEFDPDEDNLLAYDPNYIVEGKDDDVGFVKGMFQSFGDAPGGFSEEMKEITWALGAEYSYQDSFAFRAGYFNESDDKGARKFFALGAGFNYNIVGLDISYLFSASKVPSPLENTLRFSLSFNIDREAYREY
ncbi:type IX secretion system outer membrane channel protein PorV [Mangrovimonas sp. AS39]|uniref:type IX secretion system outer membrane channel protein PorV n=1 Tax=Mangrovimonas TaxID=1211036 RepID=UPI00141E50DE|nr:MULTISPECIES: type IX secretion system outer membrane channel protein PorV [Mangrovimonas]MCF1191466.1 type IX secretion system outer membrane channel protein PorV [Mangrovimonas futianensis]MCF1195161.1 type IX secretion system outer membrane channel protein PorV [Mangrovimonas futianensis]MCF1421161.1 type IX secretion system outer membrane channel protein PorV [Mangrovimonas futianensis]NIK92297.1 type IX secretion system outer membrane channel protein PorV [Mangrovimonas sp. CR14]